MVKPWMFLLLLGWHYSAQADDEVSGNERTVSTKFPAVDGATQLEDSNTSQDKNTKDKFSFYGSNQGGKVAASNTSKSSGNSSEPDQMNSTDQSISSNGNLEQYHPPPVNLLGETDKEESIKSRSLVKKLKAHVKRKPSQDLKSKTERDTPNNDHKNYTRTQILKSNGGHNQIYDQDYGQPWIPTESLPTSFSGQHRPNYAPNGPAYYPKSQEYDHQSWDSTKQLPSLFSNQYPPIYFLTDPNNHEQNSEGLKYDLESWDPSKPLQSHFSGQYPPNHFLTAPNRHEHHPEGLKYDHQLWDQSKPLPSPFGSQYPPNHFLIAPDRHEHHSEGLKYDHQLWEQSKTSPFSRQYPPNHFSTATKNQGQGQINSDYSDPLYLTPSQYNHYRPRSFQNEFRPDDFNDRTYSQYRIA